MSRVGGVSRGNLPGVLMGLSYGAGWAICAVWLGRLMSTYDLSPLPVMFWRALLVTIMLAVFLVIRDRAKGCPGKSISIKREHLLLMAAFGLVGMALNNTSWGLSIKLNGVTVATVMAYSAPIFTVLLAYPLYGERVTRRKAMSLALALTGCLLVSQIYDLDSSTLTAFGIAVAVSVGVFQAGRDLMGKVVGRHYEAATSLLYGFGFGALFMALPQLSSELLLPLPVQGWLELLGISAGVMVSYGLYLGALRRLPVSVASILGLTEPVVAAGLAYLVLDEVLSPIQVFGAVLVVSGVLLLEIRDE